MGIIIGLLVGGVILVLAEMVIPGLVAGIVGSLMILTGVIMGFRQDTALGMGLLVGVVIFAIATLWAWVKFFPSSPIGRLMFPVNDARDWHGFEQKNAAMLGKKGTAHTMLRPSGVVLIDGERVDVVTEGEIIEKGTAVQVVEVEGNRVVVAAVPAAGETDNQPA